MTILIETESTNGIILKVYFCRDFLTMLIAVNTRLLINNKLEGLGRFSYETLKRITRSHPEHQFLFIFDRPFAKEFIFSDNIQPVIAFPQARHPVLWYLFFEWGIPHVLKKYKPDVFLSPDGWLSLRTNVPSIPVIHDLNFFHNPEWISWLPMKYYSHFFPQFIYKARHILTVSEFSKTDIIQRFKIDPNKIDVVYNGTNLDFKPIPENNKKQIKNEYTDGEDYFLFVGLVHPRKNLTRIIEAFNKFKEKTSSATKLLVVGSTKYWTSDTELAYKRSVNRNDIIFLDRVNHDTLKALMAATLCLVYASLFEGFGIPILEAYSCQVPVITSNVTSMPEVGGEAAIYVDPLSVDSIANAMIDVFNTPFLSEDLKEKMTIQCQRYSWDDSSERMWNAIEKTIQN